MVQPGIIVPERGLRGQQRTSKGTKKVSRGDNNHFTHSWQRCAKVAISTRGQPAFSLADMSLERSESCGKMS